MGFNKNILLCTLIFSNQIWKELQASVKGAESGGVMIQLMGQTKVAYRNLVS